MSFLFFFFNDTATTEIYTLSLHDALPISVQKGILVGHPGNFLLFRYTFHRLISGADIYNPPAGEMSAPEIDRKSTRLNSSHGYISYAVFCLKKKNKKSNIT